MEDIQNIWKKTLPFIKERLQDLFYDTYIIQLKPLSVTEETINLEVPHEFLVTALESKYYPIIREALIQATGKEFKIHFYLPGQYKDNSPVVIQKTSASVNSHLCPKYTFDNFVIGDSNRMAYAAAVAISESPAIAYNPFFIYGNSGLGKTHLMHAIGNYIHEKQPSSKILYITTEDFTTEFIWALEHKKNDEFRDKYRKIDVLLIDDIQFISRKERTQEEFFHTFNALYEANKQIVISSDKPPNEISILEDRLKTRFAWGLIADIQVPDFETKVAILRKKSAAVNLEMDEKALEYVARLIGYNIRELEGALNRILMYHSVTNMPLTLETVKEALRHLRTNPTELTPSVIIDIVSRYFNVSVNDILSSNRSRNISYPRQIAMYLCRSMTHLSLPRIGDAFGGRDHTTVMHAYDQIQAKYESSAEVKECITTLKKNIQG
jgi:chromosomal replication initiator protein